ncbi:MAG TPA: polysaccharide biosynthesis/export family protein [Pyrinomonadaceae bacterium]|jgi:protein involved in polysaccharide export with SLBB domain|nr:polysaccharide biosynthesis/export family protein [Pyrinomonadaceae bacterium]
MKKFCTAFAVLLVVCTAAGARQSPSNVRVGPEAEESVPAPTPRPTPKKDEKKNRPAEQKNEPKQEPAAKQTDPGRAAKQTDIPTTTAVNNVVPADSSATPATSDAPPKNNGTAVPPAPTSKDSAVRVPAPEGGKVSSPQPASGSNAAPASPAAAQPLTNVYRVGTGDVLDIHILNDRNPRQSTLYTILAGGVLDYPLLKDPLTVAGMTTEELAAQLIADLRHRGVFERPQVRVSVREYASHAVLVSGLVADPGTKILRREAVPLYVVVAEAQPKPEAGRAVVVSHTTGKTTAVDLLDAQAMTMLVQQGDVINLTARPPEFFYIGGEISSPGQKSFNPGMTLTQAVLASGGVTGLAGAKVKVSRQGDDGRLVPVEYNLQEIEAGAVPDPVIRAGDRIEVSRAKKK